MCGVLVIQHATRVRRIILSSVAYLAVLYFLHCVINDTLLNIKLVFWFSLQLLSETFLVLKIIQPDTIINTHRSLCKVTGIVVRL